MRTKVITFVTLVVLLILCATPVYGQGVPPLPHAFYGTVMINDSPAPVGTQIEARGEGVLTGIEGNPVVTTTAGSYGSPDPMGPKLIVQGDMLDGATITFYVNGVSTEQTAEWHSGEVTELNLSATIPTVPPTVTTDPATSITRTGAILNGSLTDLGTASSVEVSFEWGTTASYGNETVTQTMTSTGSFSFALSGLSLNTTYHFRAKAVGEGTGYGIDRTFTTRAPAPPAPGGGGGGGGPPTLPPGTTSLAGLIDYRGMFTETVIAMSYDSLCRLIVGKDTIGLTKDGEPLSEIKMTLMVPRPAPPPDAHFIGLVYNLEPDGAAFNPAATLEYSYDPSNIPEGVAEEKLVLTWWDAGAGKWVELKSTVDPEANTITAPVSHFTAFAALAYTRPAVFTTTDLSIYPAEVNINESVTIGVSVANTGDLAGSYEVTLKVNNVVEASKEVTVNGGASEKVTFTTAKDVAGSYSVDINGLSGSFTVKEKPAPPPPLPPPPAPIPPPAPVVNWPLIWSIIGGVVIVGVIIFLAARKRKA